MGKLPPLFLGEFWGPITLGAHERRGDISGCLKGFWGNPRGRGTPYFSSRGVKRPFFFLKGGTPQKRIFFVRGLTLLGYALTRSPLRGGHTIVWVQQMALFLFSERIPSPKQGVWFGRKPPLPLGRLLSEENPGGGAQYLVQGDEPLAGKRAGPFQYPRGVLPRTTISRALKRGAPL